MLMGNENGPGQTIVTEEVSDGRHSLRVVAVLTGKGINIFLGGGESPHIGTVVISQPRLSLRGNDAVSCTTSVFNLVGHKDDVLAIPLGESLCKQLNQVIVVSAGVHIDGASERDIARINGNMTIIATRLMETLASQCHHKT